MNQKYITQINKSINYIINHLEEELTVEKVAEHCHFSKYYFNRLFKAVTGESIYTFIKRLRLEKSAFLLKVKRNTSITEIAEKYGLSSSNYSTAFKEFFGISPSTYRKKLKEGINKDSLFMVNNVRFKPIKLNNNNLEQISIKNLPDRRVIYKRYKGNYQEITERWEEFCQKTFHFMDDQSLYLDISYDDPSISNENSCIFDICMATEKKIPEFNTMIINGGKYALYYYKGPIAGISAAYQNIFSQWLPNTTCTLDDRRILSLYDQGKQENNNIKMNICIPIK